MQQAKLASTFSRTTNSGGRRGARCGFKILMHQGLWGRSSSQLMHMLGALQHLRSNNRAEHSRSTAQKMMSRAHQGYIIRRLDLDSP